MITSTVTQLPLGSRQPTRLSCHRGQPRRAECGSGSPAIPHIAVHRMDRSIEIASSTRVLAVLEATLPTARALIRRGQAETTR